MSKFIKINPPKYRYSAFITRVEATRLMWELAEALGWSNDIDGGRWVYMPYGKGTSVKSQVKIFEEMSPYTATRKKRKATKR